jgi:hypothetical protein
MSTSPDQGAADEQRLRLVAAICRNLRISLDDLLADPAFRKEIGAEELDRVEEMSEQEMIERDNTDD